MWKEPYYRKKIRPEHWQRFVELIPKVEWPLSITEQSDYAMAVDSVAQQIQSNYLELYADEPEYELN